MAERDDGNPETGEETPESTPRKKKATPRKRSPRKKAASKKKSPAKKSTAKKSPAKKSSSRKTPAKKSAPKPEAPPPPPPEPEETQAAPESPPPPPTGPVTEEEILAVLHAHYPRGQRPASVGFYLTPEWRKNLEARFQAEQGQRFFESLVESVEQRSGLDVAERFSLVDRPAFCLRVLLHDGERFPGPILTDSFLRDLDGEARLLDVWISALGPYYYAKGYRLWPTMKEELEGAPPPLDRKDPIALRAMRILAGELKKIGFRRVPGKVAKISVPGIRFPGQIVDENPTAFELLFDGATASAVTGVEAEPARRERPPPPESPASYEVDQDIVDPDLKREIDLEVEIFQRELEDEIDAIKAEMDNVRRRRRR